MNIQNHGHLDKVEITIKHGMRHGNGQEIRLQQIAC